MPAPPPEALNRLAAVCRVARLDPHAAPVPVVSYSNDTWLLDDRRLGPTVLRIGWRGDVHRLVREAAVAQFGPAELGYPQLLSSGGATANGAPLRWTLTRRLTGQPVDEVWPALSPSARRAAVDRLARMLRALHDWHPSADVARLISQRPCLDLTAADSIVGADNNPLPLARAHALAAHAGALRFVDPGVVRAAVDAIDELAELEPTLDDPSATGLTHGDVHLNNLWWDGSSVRALLDLEWTRFAPRDLELERLADNADADVREGLDVYPQVLRWLLADYPQLVDVPRMPERLRLYSLTHALRHVFAWPPSAPEAELAPDHPLVRLRRLVSGAWPAPGALPEVLVG